MYKNKVLFIVDDDEDDINLFVEAVNEIDKSMGCFKAKNGEDALARLEELEMLPDVIFLDLNMPKMNGRETLERLKSSEKFKNIPVVIYSTSNAEQDKIDTKNLGASDYLTKPDSFTELCVALARTIRTQAEKGRE
jgi:CheY-like chemotaxis protein